MKHQSGDRSAGGDGRGRPDKGLVCVTGAAGFIGSHVTMALVEAGYRVRALVRDASDSSKVGHISGLPGVEIAGADLQRTTDLAKSIEGCNLIVHTASPVKLNARDPDAEIVRPAIEATRNVMRAACAVGGVRRVVQTSSVAAVVDTSLPDSHLFTEDDWNTATGRGMDPYPRSKILAEREAASYRDRIEVVAINPSFVLGPVLAKAHLRSSPSLVRAMLQRKLPGCPRLSMGVVDVRDVALAHVRALESNEASGRYICSNVTLWTGEIADILDRQFPNRRLRTRRLPDALVWLGVIFDRRLSVGYLRRNLGRFHRFSNTRIAADLGLQFRPVEETLRDTARSMTDGGWI